MTSDPMCRLAAFGLALALAGCAAAQTAPASPPGSSAAPAAGDTAALYRQMREEIGDATCSAADQCHTLAVGHKACGGPETYLVWSSRASDGARLRTLAEAYASARRAENQKSGRVSDCSMVSDPGARCESGRCVKAGRSPALMQVQ
jgi:hypothetical protein